MSNTNAVAVLISQPPPAGQQNGELIGYNVGYKLYNSTLPYAYLTRTVSELSEPMSVIISGLDKFSKYAIHVQAFNRVGTGPKSADSISLTMEDGGCFIITLLL